MTEPNEQAELFQSLSPPSETKGAENTPPATLPDGAEIVLPVRNLVLFPGVVTPMTVGRAKSLAAAQEAVRAGRPIAVLLQREEDTEDPGPADLYEVGTLANVLRYMTAPDGTHHLVVQGTERFRIQGWVDGNPFLAAQIERLPEKSVDGAEVEARAHHLKNRALEAVGLLPNPPQELAQAISAVKEPALLADMVATYLDATPAEKQELLEVLDLKERLDRVIALVDKRIEVLRLTRDLSKQTRETMDKRQREYLLREQLRTIQKELGEADEQATEIEALEKAIDKAGMPKETEEHARKELKRLARMQEASAEYPMVRTYLEWLTELPWSVTTDTGIDIKESKRVLDEDHFGLDKIKKRILEFLAVRKLNPGGKSPILCFVGPPGVGKTSLGQSIARATGRKFQRVSLGGVHDESEIRGHRRTYVGALPGTIIQAIRKAGSRDGVIMLDEMDKLGQGFHGDPSAALLEVLDPEQNSTFRDTYLGVPFDLSKVMFIATANTLDSIPGPLRDRMEIVQLAGYTQAEKLQIAKRYLVDRQLEANGLKAEQVEITDAALEAIIDRYTREAGVRSLERHIGAALRPSAMKIADGEVSHVKIDVDDLAAILGGRRFEDEVALRTGVPGVATGMAWTPVGGDILFIEASRYPGSGKLVLTGQLGEVMKESAQTAFSLVKSRAVSLGIEDAAFEKHDVHIHVPAGATPKDGPSAGVAMFTALVSLLTNRPVRPDVAMTGEISLRGLVLPIGGVKEKVTAALRAGITTVLLPKRNSRDYEEVPAEARDKLSFVWLDSVDDAIRHALGEDVLPVQKAA